LRDRIVDPLVRIGLAEAGSGGDHLGQITAIGRRRFCAVAEIGGEQAR
jgi:hypothetical protein